MVESDETVDVVLSDVVLPGGVSGLALRERLQRVRPNLPVVLMTGHGSIPAALGSAGGLSEVGTNNAANAVSLHKPFSIDELMVAVASAIAAPVGSGDGSGGSPDNGKGGNPPEAGKRRSEA